MLSRIVRLRFLSTDIDAGLLFLRVSTSISLFLKHGYEKIFTFSAMAPTFSDPLHLGSTTSLIIAMIGDSICSILVIFGLATRWATLFSFGVIFVAWSLKFKYLYFHGLGHYAAEHGQLMVLYLLTHAVIFISGPGRYSVDARLKG
jgi:putative oxidoreductase